MRQRILIVGATVLLGLSGFAAAQSPQIRAQAELGVRAQNQTILSGNLTLEMNGMRMRAERAAVNNDVITLTGNVVIEMNGVRVRADRAVLTEKGGNIALEGNVRLTPPAK